MNAEDRTSLPPDDFVVALVTTQSEEEAAQIARALVEEKLAACVNLVSPIRSIYRWENAVTESRETLMIIKTARARFSELQQRVTNLHSYDTPEIIALPLAGGLEKYLAWVADCTEQERA